ncbi:short-chain dehydrogenase [Polyplosphaeria fusca]|uniref:Short-chain dehydrogenase n=1 Tax=Polyplosphaeria fusca TaxID=682080 RepID=A0A9P4QFR7_9PLEO|nr:short-chain dehydrogenase [Polyplosphaeria fusca]
MGGNFSQIFPGKPKWTEKDIQDLSGKVYIVTGSNTGIGKEVASILYSKNSKVYIAARTPSKAESAISSIKAAHPNSKGSLAFLRLDLADLSTIKASANEFLSKEKKLDVLFNNAGVWGPPLGTTTPQGLDLQMGTNCVGPFLFTKLLTPILAETAKTEPTGSVRVVWLSSSGAEMVPKGGIRFDDLNNTTKRLGPLYQYAATKCGNYYQSTEYAKRYRSDNIVSVAINPGNLDSDLFKDANGILKVLLKFMLYPPIYGAYTQLFAGVSKAVTMEKTGSWIVPWGRFTSIRSDLANACKDEKEGGTGKARQFWEWNEEQVKSYFPQHRRLSTQKPSVDPMLSMMLHMSTPLAFVTQNRWG